MDIRISNCFDYDYLYIHPCLNDKKLPKMKEIEFCPAKYIHMYILYIGLLLDLDVL